MKIKLLVIAVLFRITTNAQCYRYIDAGIYHVLALKSDNTLWGWGANYSGELGDGTYQSRPAISQIGTASNWLTIATGSEHTIALKTDGTLWTWGSNNSGQLGDGTTIKKNTPVQIGTDNDWQSISAKGNTSFAIKNNGTLWGWGQNNISNVGLGFYSLNITVPTQVGTATNWKNVYAGFDITVAIKTDNTLWAWGSNLYGKIGVGGFMGNYLSPIQVGTDNDWKEVSTGYHTLALKQNGTLWAWGNNSYGELGDNTTTNKDLPMQVGTANDWLHIHATTYSSYGIKNNATLWTWGSNANYEMGNGTTTNISIPTQINNETNWKIIAPRGGHVEALKTDNSIYYWGANYGFLPATVVTTPTQMANNCLLSTESFNLDEQVKLFPNPANHMVTIENQSNEKITTIVFYDLIGKEVVSLKNNFETIHVDKLQNGMYLVIINFENDFTKTVKFIKK
jgi:alpha-tubulin suppressor-like RCC1 family protein